MVIKTCKFVVSGQPVGKGRPRFTKSGHTYTPQATKGYESLIQKTAWVAMQRERLKPTSRRVSVIITAFMEIPKSYSKTKVMQCQCGILIPPRPDIDNITKSILDGCNGIVFLDDAQVWHLTVFKRYTDVEQEPNVSVQVQWDDPI